MSTTFADETSSGRWSKQLRGSRRVIVLARAGDGANYEWLMEFKREFLPPGVEAGSTNVIPILDLQPRARQLVLNKVEAYSIFVVDLHEYRRRLLEELVHQVRPLVPPHRDPYDFVLQLPHVGSTARELLRQIAIEDSVLGRLESLLEWARNPFAGELKREGLDSYGNTQQVQVASRYALDHMREEHLAPFLARLGAAVGDALSPFRQAQAILESVQHLRFIGGGYFAYRVLSVELGMDRIYDIGPEPVRLQLENAHKRIYDFVERQPWGRVSPLARRGVLDERSSDTELGLQAADIAAALASREYETATDREVGARAHSVKRIFRCVCLNGRWQ